MKTTSSLIVSLGIVFAGISGVAKADSCNNVTEQRTVTYVDSCNNLVTYTEPVVVRYYQNGCSNSYSYVNSCGRSYRYAYCPGSRYYGKFGNSRWSRWSGYRYYRGCR